MKTVGIATGRNRFCGKRFPVDAAENAHAAARRRSKGVQVIKIRDGVNLNFL